MTPADDIEDDLDEEAEGGKKKKKKTKKQKKAALKKLIIMGIGGLFVLLIVGGVTAFFMGWLNPLLGIEEEHKVAEVQLGSPVNHELPQIKADLKTSKCRSPFLRATISVQLSEHDVERLQETQDRVMDHIITHLRDQERQDLVGKAGSDQLRFDLVNIVNNVINPARIFGITFKEFVLQ
jgi:flagellar basal body-associated protein FliL